MSLDVDDIFKSTLANLFDSDRPMKMEAIQVALSDKRAEVTERIGASFLRTAEVSQKIDAMLEAAKAAVAAGTGSEDSVRMYARMLEGLGRMTDALSKQV